MVRTGGSLRLIEQADAGFPGSLGQDWANEPLSALGTRQMSHDARQSIRRPSFARGTARLSFQVCAPAVILLPWAHFT